MGIRKAKRGKNNECHELVTIPNLSLNNILWKPEVVISVVRGLSSVLPNQISSAAISVVKYMERRSSDWIC